MPRRPRKKSKTLTSDQRQEIADRAVNYPEESDKEIALRFGVTPHQVRYARTLAETGEIVVRRERASYQLRVGTRMTQVDKAEMLEEQITRTLAQLSEDSDLPPERRSWCLDKVVRTERMLQEMRLVGVLKAANAGIITELVRLFEPDASEQQVVEHYMVAEQRWKELQH